MTSSKKRAKQTTTRRPKKIAPPNRRRVLFAALVLSVVVVVTALLLWVAFDDEDGGSDQPASGNTRFLPTPTPVFPQTITVWHPFDAPSPQNALSRIAAAFEATYPNIDVQLRAVDPSALRADYESAVATGFGPEILIAPSSWVMPLAQAGLIESVSLNLYDLITGPGYLSKAMAQAALIGDVPYAVGFAAEYATLYVNKDLVSSPPTDVDSLLRLGAELGLVLPDTFFSTSGLYLANASDSLSSGDGADITPEKLEAFLAELDRFTSAPNITFTTDMTSFLDGQVGLMIGSSADYGVLLQAMGEQLVVAPLPRIVPANWRPLLRFYSAMQNINNTVEASAAADLFMGFLVSSEGQSLWFQVTGQGPANATSFPDEALGQAWGSSLEHGIAVPLNPDFEHVVEPALDAAIQAVVRGQQAPDEAAQRAISQVGVEDTDE